MTAEEARERSMAALGDYYARQREKAERATRVAGGSRKPAQWPSEAYEQRVLCRWLKAAGLLYAANQEGAYHGDAIQGRIAKYGGQKNGRPDIEIFTPPPKHPTARGVAIEMKSTRPGAKASPEQLVWLEHLSQVGWVTTVAYGAQDAIDWLRSLGFGQ